jgi:Glycine rich protein/HYDIN/CFA65/VesB-like, Ig-like domain
MGISCDARPRGRARRLRALGASVVGVAVVAALAGPAAGAPAAATTQSFMTPGTYTFTVPAGVSSISATAVGGAGGSSSFQFIGGQGASVGGTFSVTPGEQLAVGVGASAPAASGGIADGPGGAGGGGAGGVVAAGGGGASVLSLLPISPGFAASDLLVAGGGGGGGFVASGGNAGAPGGSFVLSQGGAAGTATAGGAGGIDSTGGGANGQAGSFGLGGLGGGQDINGTPDGGGGGGGGYYGGGGGAGGDNSGAGGGGGSSFLAPSATNPSGPTPTTASPSVTITYQAPSQPTATFSTQSLKFGRAQPVGSISSQQTLQVSNAGTAPLVISGVQTGGADPGDFLLDDLCQQPIAPGSSCQLGVRFAPQAKGSRTATLAVVTNAPTAPAPVTLTGTGGKAGKGSMLNQGSAGSGGQVVCRAGERGGGVCEIECAPGKYQIHGTSVGATFSVQQGDRTVAHGRLELKRGTVSRHTLLLEPGSYTLIISTGHGKHEDVLVRLPFRVP